MKTKTMTEKLSDVERGNIVMCLRAYRGLSMKVVADKLGIARSTLYRKIEKHKIKPSEVL